LTQAALKIRGRLEVLSQYGTVLLNFFNSLSTFTDNFWKPTVR